MTIEVKSRGVADSRATVRRGVKHHPWFVGLSAVSVSSGLPSESAADFHRVFDGFVNDIMVVVAGLDAAVSAYGSSPMEFGFTKSGVASSPVSVASVFESLHRHFASCLNDLNESLSPLPSTLNNAFVSTISSKTYECGVYISAMDTLQNMNGIKMELQHDENTGPVWPSSQDRSHLQAFTVRFDQDVAVARTTMSRLLSDASSVHTESLVTTLVKALLTSNLCSECSKPSTCFLGRFVVDVYDETRKCVEEHISSAHDTLLNKARDSLSDADAYFKSHVEHAVWSDCQTVHDKSVDFYSAAATKRLYTREFINDFAVQQIESCVAARALNNVVIMAANTVLTQSHISENIPNMMALPSSTSPSHCLV